MTEYATLQKEMEKRKELQAQLQRTIAAMRETLNSRREFDLRDLEKQAKQRDQTNIKGRKVS